MLDDLRADVRYAARALARTPAFALMAVLSLALGIGANTVVFSVINALVLKPLPVHEPERLFFLESDSGPSESFPHYRDLRDRNRTFAGLAGYRITPISLDDGRTPARIWGYLATGNYFDVLGIKPALGRFFHQQDDLRAGQAPFAVLSHDCWTARFGGDPAVIGRTIRVNQTTVTVLGVAPRGFRGTELFYQAEIWIPMMMQPQIEVGNPWLENRSTWDTWVIGRLKPGASAGAAAGDLDSIDARLALEYPDTNEGFRIRLARPGLVGDLLGGPVRAFTFGVMILAALVLLAACANLASVLAARGADRQRELAIRISIGASRWRIVRQLLTETLMLSVAGGAMGCALAFAGARALTAWRAPLDFPVQLDIAVDTRVLLFACGVSLLAGLLFGVSPARQASRTDPNRALKETAGANATSHRWPIRDLLVAVQVALCVVLVSASLLALRGLQQASTMRLGFDPAQVSMVGLDLGLAGYGPDAGPQFQRRALDAVARLPGVQAAAYSNSLPLSIDQSTNRIYPDDQPALQASQARSAAHYQVSPGFLQTLGIVRKQGRDIDWRDAKGAPRVAIVNETFARTIMRTRNPIGRHFGRAQPIEIVGVVEDGKYQSLTESPRAAYFEPMLQNYNGTTIMLRRSALPSEQIVTGMRQAIGSLDPVLPLYGAGSVDRMLGFAMFPSRAAAAALTAFGILAVILAATGINGLVTYAVSKRQRELGIRMAMGASSGDILRAVLGRMTLLLAIGATVGLALAAAAGRVLATVVYQAAPDDPVVLTSVVVLFIGIAIVSCWAPARRSLRTEPMQALRPD